MPSREFAIHTRTDRKEGLVVRGPAGTPTVRFLKLRRAFDYVRSQPGSGKVKITLLDPRGEVLKRMELPPVR